MLRDLGATDIMHFTRERGRLVLFVAALVGVTDILIGIRLMLPDSQNCSNAHMGSRWALLLNNESTCENDGLAASVGKTRRTNDRLELVYVLASTGRMKWAFRRIERLHCDFWMDDGESFAGREGVFLVMDEAFVRGDKDYFETTLTISVPHGARFITIAFGKSDLITGKIRIPAEEGIE